MSSLSNNKQIATNTLFLYLRMFLTMAVSLYTVRVVIQTLTISDYGIYGAVGGIILSFGFISGVLTNASQRFFSYELGKGNKSNLKEIFSTIFFSYLCISIIIVFLADTLGLWFLTNKMSIPEGREDAAMWVFQFTLLTFLVTILTNPFQAMIIAHEKMNLYAYLSILDVTLKLSIVYALLLFNTDKLKLYSVLMFVSCLITNSIYIIYCRKKYVHTHLILHVDKDILKSVFSYSSWTLFGTLSNMCNTQGMNLVLNIFFGPLANAAYSISSHVYHTVGAFANNFYIAVKPALIKNYSAGNLEYVNKLFVFSSKAIFILLFIIVLPLLICTEEILLIWLGQISEYMVAFVQLSLVYTIILAISYPITGIVQASGNIKLYHGAVDTFSLLALPVMYLLFKMGFGASYAYIVSISIFSFAHTIRIYVLKKVFPIFNATTYFVRFIIPALLASVGCYITMTFIQQHLPEGLIWTIITCILSCIITLIVCFVLLFTRSERFLIVNLIRKI